MALVVHGVVQGVGFRPFVHHAARSRGLSGCVRNTPRGVRIEVQGSEADLSSFVDTLLHEHPPHAIIDRLETQPLAPGPHRPFEVLESEVGEAAMASIPPDVAVCADCLHEVTTPGERRYRYPFTNCAHCGPRYSIVEASPYDRQRTSMKTFPLCPACRAEYEDPSDRRFHAQPIACPVCGPQLALRDASGAVLAVRDAALDAACARICDGYIVALKGLGGFQLVVDATNDAAVRRLRARKRREEKPLAVMVVSPDMAKDYCFVSDEEADVLVSPACPIVLMRQRDRGVYPQPRWNGAVGRVSHATVPEAAGETCPTCSFAIRHLPFAIRCSPFAIHANAVPPPIALSVAPGNPRWGIMLPCTPLHQLMMRGLQRPVVCTSGNVSDEPMCVDFDEARERLSDIADVFLTHDRPIVRQVDDSVVRVARDGIRLVRRARGYAPAGIDIGLDGPPILAFGGHLKNTIALRIGSNVVLSQHVGDLDDARARTLFERTVADLLAFHGVSPAVVACDGHPDYASTQYAVAFAAARGIPLLRVQHHDAHVLSVMAEHRLDGQVLGFAWDGSGFGADGTVWGGEALLCDGRAFDRVAHLRPFRLPGGEQAVREPRRTALGLLYEIMGDGAWDIVGDCFSPNERRVLGTVLHRETLTPVTTSIGRLFDAVACLAGLGVKCSFEGQAAMALEHAADPNAIDRPYHVPLTGHAPTIADWEPMVRHVLTDLKDKVPLGVVAGRFHGALGDYAVAIARSAACSRVALSGGCFQNALLADLVRSRLEDAGFQVFENRLVPANDGGLALGQVLAAAVRDPRLSGTLKAEN